MRHYVYTYILLLSLVLPIGAICSTPLLIGEENITVPTLTEEETEHGSSVELDGFHYMLELKQNNFFATAESASIKLDRHNASVRSGKKTNFTPPPEV